MFDLDAHYHNMQIKFAENYYIVEQKPLGAGTYGTVFKAFSKERQHVVAIKTMNLGCYRDDGMPTNVMREVTVLKTLKSDYIVKLFEVFFFPTELKLVLEFVEGDLKRYIKSLRRPMSPCNVKYLTWQLIQGLHVCHARMIIHRDIKPANILIDSMLRLKLADFGLARPFSDLMPKYTREVVTLWYRAPEILLGSALYSIGIDIWAAGCVFAEIATGQPLFAGDSEIGTLFKVFQKLGTPANSNWPGVAELPFFKETFPKWPAKSCNNIRNMTSQVGADGINLLESLLRYDPKERISARLSLRHNYLKEAVIGPPS